MRVWIVSLAAVAMLGCSGEKPCPSGAVAVNGVCVVNVPGPGCGPGTTVVDGQCVALAATSTGSGPTCGPGTVQKGGACVPAGGGGAGGGLSCGPGTVKQGGECVPASSGTGLMCGPGTMQQGNVCVPAGTGSGTSSSGTGGTGGAADAGDAGDVVCGAGTTEIKGQCVPASATYEVLIPVTQLPADGFSTIPITVIGSDQGSNPALDSVVISLSRVNAGSLAPTVLKLGPAGAAAAFIPCSSGLDPLCAGTFTINVANELDPNKILGTSPTITLVAPMGVGTDAACLGGGNVIYFNGDAGDYIHPGTATIKQGAWSAKATATNIAIHVTPSNPADGLWWDLTFDSSQLPGKPALTTQVYTDAERWPFEMPGHPGQDVTGDGKGCNMSSGQFQIEALTLVGGTVSSFTATFEQSCDGGPLLHGCVHFGP